eukprot:GHVU01138614.1.p2 GENE.GHVU01138614.1~~GHVU01138614.1.p2  ORF type:complete len:132 (-),score=2.45 GHVU01138614.1:172-567(-)
MLRLFAVSVALSVYVFAANGFPLTNLLREDSRVKHSQLEVDAFGNFHTIGFKARRCFKRVAPNAEEGVCLVSEYRVPGGWTLLPTNFLVSPTLPCVDDTALWLFSVLLATILAEPVPYSRCGHRMRGPRDP